MRAIIIDDSRAIRMILKRMLDEMSFQTFEAGNGREACDVLSRTGPLDLALVDWNMPEMNGYEFIKTIRADPTHRQMAIMMVTTESEHDKVVKALAAGAHEYVMKPFTKDVIIEKLQILGFTKVEP